MHISFFAAFLLNLLACNLDKTFQNGVPPQSQATADTTKYVPTEPEDTLNVEKIAKTRIDSNSKVIYLTFDDGPLAFTPFLTDIVHEKQIKMSEFAVGLHALMNKSFMKHLDAMKRSPYIEVCNHSYSHAYGKYQVYYSKPDVAAQEIIDNETKLGLLTKIVRMPGRDIWATDSIKRGWSQSGGKTAEILYKAGFKIYGWDMEWDHYGNTLPKRTPAQIVSLIDGMFARNETQIKNHLVFLGHDEMLAKEKGRQDLRQIIDMLKERGYIFEFISNYPY
ncbi:MAG: polysaccharide deacetylase family protein [Saprospiraceae bacterium]|nr:polysaccharide deacetylase family protein [Saprospiraceae bacterium]